MDAEEVAADIEIEETVDMRVNKVICYPVWTYGIELWEMCQQCERGNTPDSRIGYFDLSKKFRGTYKTN